MNKICVATTVHYALDTRIYYKQVQSLTKKYSVDYYAKAIDQDVPIQPGRFIALPNLPGLIGRVKAMWHLFKLLRKSDYDAYHFHDPELLLLGIYLKIRNKTVIFDMHEDIRQDIADGKQFLNRYGNYFALRLYLCVDKIARSYFDWFILAEDSYQRYFMDEENYSVVHNYPIIINTRFPREKKYPHGMVYVGSITEIRGAIKMIHVLEKTRQTIPDATLHLIGSIDTYGLETILNKMIMDRDLKENVYFYGRIPNASIYEVLTHCGLGMCLLDDTIKSFRDSLPTKIFEYMMARIPFIVTDVPLWSHIIRMSKSGYVADYKDIDGIAKIAVRLLMDHEHNEQLGKWGYESLARYFSWDREEQKLCTVYENLI